MKRIVKAALLTCVAAALPSVCFAQGAAAAAGQCQMPDAEFQVYNNGNTQTDPKAKAAGLETYLTQFPNSCMKLPVLSSLVGIYNQAGNNAQAVNAADRVLQLDPNNLQALAQETYLHYTLAGAMNDADPKKLAAMRQPELDLAASYAQKELAASKPAGVSDADFTAFKEQWFPYAYTSIAYAAFNKGDFASAIDGYKKELAFFQGDPKLAPQLQSPSTVLQDTYYLGASYFQSQPVDYLNCAFYATRAASFAPDNFKAAMVPTAKYCYHEYHGQTDDQYDQLTQIAKTNVFAPTDLGTTITPKPTPAEIIAGILKTTTPDQLATSDKEYILQNGTPDQVATVWDSMKSKAFQFPDMVVVSSTPQQVQVASPAAVVPGQTPTADFTFNMAPPEDLPKNATPLQKKKYQATQAAIAAAIAPGQTVTLSGTFDSYTPKPFMITLTDGAVILPEAEKPSPAHAAAAHHTPPHHAQ